MRSPQIDAIRRPAAVDPVGEGVGEPGVVAERACRAVTGVLRDRIEHARLAGPDLAEVVGAGEQPLAERRGGGHGALLLGLAVVIYLFDGIGAHVAARLTGLHSPGLAPMAGLSPAAGMIAVVFVMIVAYYATIAAHRFRVDPDIYGVPAVTSSVDLFGSVVLVTLAALLILPG